MIGLGGERYISLTKSSLQSEVGDSIVVYGHAENRITSVGLSRAKNSLMAWLLYFFDLQLEPQCLSMAFCYLCYMDNLQNRLFSLLQLLSLNISVQWLNYVSLPFYSLYVPSAWHTIYAQ